MVIMKWDIERRPDGRPTLSAQWTSPAVPQPRTSHEDLVQPALISA